MEYYDHWQKPLEKLERNFSYKTMDQDRSTKESYNLWSELYHKSCKYTKLIISHNFQGSSRKAISVYETTVKSQLARIEKATIRVPLTSNLINYEAFIQLVKCKSMCNPTTVHVTGYNNRWCIWIFWILSTWQYHNLVSNLHEIGDKHTNRKEGWHHSDAWCPQTTFWKSLYCTCLLSRKPSKPVRKIYCHVAVFLMTPFPFCVCDILPDHFTKRTKVYFRKLPERTARAFCST